MTKLRIFRRFISNSPLKTQNVVTSFGDEILRDEWESATPYKDIPGPQPLPFFGNTWRFIPFIGDFQTEHVDKVSQKLFKKYGKIVKMEGLMGRPDMLFLFDPNEIEKVFRQEDALPLRPSMPSLNYYKHVYRKEFFGDDNCGVIAVHGEKWQSFRTKVNQIMLQPRVSKMYVKSIATTSQELVHRIELIKNAKDEVPDDFINEIHKWSLESIAKIALDVRLGCLDKNATDTQTLIDAVTTFFMLVPILELKIPFWRLWKTPSFQKYLEALDTIREITMKHINAALDNLSSVKTEELSVLQRVLKMDNNVKTAINLAFDMFLVGIDTTSNAVASILYQLSIHPQKQEKLYHEIKEILSGTQISHEKLDQMHYLKACIKETMRMYPVVIGNGRCTTSDRVIGGYQVPKGVQVIFQHYVISNTEEYFPRCNEFLPERWIKNSELYGRHHCFASLPFGFGKRMCLGRRFADLEIQTVLAEILANYKIEYHYEKLDYHIHPMYTPNGPLRLKFLKR